MRRKDKVHRNPAASLNGVMETLETKCKLLDFLCNRTLLDLYLIFYTMAMRMFFKDTASAN